MGWLDDGRATGFVQIVFGVIVIGVFGLFVYTVRDVLSPPVVFLLLLFVLSPLWGRPLYKTIAIGATGLLVLWMLRETGFLLAPFILAFILAYMLDPLVDQVQRLRLSRTLSIGALTVPVLGAIVFALAFGLPALGRELASLAGELPGAWNAVAGWLDGVRDRIIALGIPGLDQESVPRVSEIEPEALADYVDAGMAERLLDAVVGLGRGLGTLLTVLSYVVLTPIVTFYLLRDYDRIVRRIKELLPERTREGWSAFGAQYNDLLSRYLRGQVTVAMIIGLITFLGFWILRFPFALALGAVTGAFSLVPYIGFYVSLAPAVAVALLSGDPLISLLKVGLVFGGGQILEAAVLSPLIVGQSVELNPVWILVALSLFGFFFGFVGVLIAVPLAILVKLALGRGLEAYRRSAFYQAASPAE